jgi:YVTN family beta-propeller protein
MLRPGQSSSQQLPRPYVGLRPFERTPDDQARFFGRDQEARRITSMILSHPVTLVYSRSGAGKTSLFNAKILPSLEEYEFQILPSVRVKAVLPVNEIPTDTRNIYVFNVLQALCPNASLQALAEKTLPVFLREYRRSTKADGDMAPRIIIFDQLEELFNLFPEGYQEQRKDFFKQIAQALEEDPLLRIVFVIREEYLAQLDPFAALLPDRMRARFRLEGLRRESALLAVIGPLRKMGLHLPEGVPEKIVDNLRTIHVENLMGESEEVKGEYVEPVQLQIVCQKLWSKGLPEKVTEEGLGDVDKALEDFYVDGINEASKRTRVKEQIIRKWFEEKLITSSGTRSVVHRGPESTGELSNNVVNVLENKYLIRKEERSGAQWYELTHDRLIKPIKDSNKKWREERNRKSRRNGLVIIPSVIVTASAVTITLLFMSGYFSQPLDICSLHPVISTGIHPAYLAINPNTNTVYVANRDSNTVSVIDCNGFSGKTDLVIKSLQVGGSPEGVGVNPKTNMIYVANYNYNTISVIDGRTNTVGDNIQVGVSPKAIAVNPTTNMVYVVNEGSNTVSFIDGKTNTVVNTITVGTSPSAIAINPTTNRIYVVNSNDSISVIDGNTNGIVRNVRVVAPLDIATTMDKIYITNGTGYGFSSTVSVIDGKTNAVVNRINVGTGLASLSVDQKSNIIYVSGSDSDTVYVINGTNNAALTPLSVGKGPIGLTVNPNTHLLYVANSNDNTVSIINIAGVHKTVNLKQLPQIPALHLAHYPMQINVDPNTSKIYVANYYSNTVSVINVKTNKSDIINVVSRPSAVAVNPTTNKIYVANHDSNSVSIIDGNTDKIVKNVTVGIGPKGVAVNPTTNMVYVADQGNNTVSVIDGNTNTLVKNVSLGHSPSNGGIAVNPRTNTVYIANGRDNIVSIIDGNTNTVVKNVTVGRGPGQVAVNSHTNRIYVTNFDSDTVSIIDGNTNTVVKNVTVGHLPVGIAVDLKSDTIFVSNKGSKIHGTISILDGKEETVIRTLLAGNTPISIAIDSKADKVYVLNQGDATISVINIPVKGLADFIQVGVYPTAIAVNPTTNMVYVVNEGSNTVSFIDGKTNTVVNTITVGTSPSAIAINPTTNRIYVANSGNNSVSVIDGNLNRIVKNVTVGIYPGGIAVNPTTNMVYVSNWRNDTVSAINGNTNSIVKGLIVGKNPIGIAVNSNSDYVYVANYRSNTMTVIDGKTNTVVNTIPVGGFPSAIAINPTTNRIYVANNNSISVIDESTNTIMKTLSTPKIGSINDSASNQYDHHVNAIPYSNSPGLGPALAINQHTDLLYAVNVGTNTLSVINGTTNAVTKIQTGDSPMGVVANTNTVYVANFFSNTVSAFPQIR